MAYEARDYRNRMETKDLVSFQVMIKETDLAISAVSDLSEEAHRHLREIRRGLEQYLRKHPEFLSAMEPLTVNPDAPPLIREMAKAGEAAGVGPMAAVAGAVAEAVGRKLLAQSPEVIVENGGDIFLVSKRERIISIEAGDSPFSRHIGIRIGKASPLGICTSSGTVGHSISFGKSDAVCVLAPSAALADAAATAAGNRVQGPGDLREALDFLAQIPGISGGLIVFGKKMGAWGEVELVKL
ncbi:MAG: UPF0280 family protein [Deltaproteobacteria bacterium]|nr:UPF0280 family protein [Deltaproteobacteria bacterium]